MMEAAVVASAAGTATTTTTATTDAQAADVGLGLDPVEVVFSSSERMASRGPEYFVHITPFPVVESETFLASIPLLKLWTKYVNDGAPAVVLCKDSKVPEGFVPIIVNEAFGGWRVSESAARALGKSPRDLHRCLNDVDLANHILAHGSLASSGDHSKLVVYMTQTELLNYVDITEYDGKEGWTFKRDKLRADLFEQAFQRLCSGPLQAAFNAHVHAHA
jgi:hypothetical protein